MQSSLRWEDKAETASERLEKPETEKTKSLHLEN